MAEQKGRIALVCTSLRAGGAERIVSRLASWFAKFHEVAIITLVPSEPFYRLPSSVRLCSPGREPCGVMAFKRARSLAHIRKALRQFNPDVVFSFGGLINSPVMLAAFGLPGRYYLFNRASPLSNPWRPITLLNRLVYPFAHGVIVQTIRAKEIMQKTYPFTRFNVLPNPIFIPKEITPIARRDKVILNVGYLGGKKNQEGLIRAFHQARKGNWKLRFIGDGPDRDKLRNIVKSMQLESSVSFLGERKNVETYLNNARIFAFSSLSEGFPNALAEGLAAGCACISYDCSTGPSELIEDGVSGLLVENANQERYAASLRRLVADDALQSNLSIAARDRIVQYSEEAVLERFSNLAFPEAFKRAGERQSIAEKAE